MPEAFKFAAELVAEIAKIAAPAARKVATETFVKGKELSSAKSLIGTEFKGSTIKNIYKEGSTSVRWVRTTDDMLWKTDKTGIARQAEIAGGRRTVGAASAAPMETRFDRALKSLEAHRSKHYTLGKNRWSYKRILAEHRDYQQQAVEAGMTAEPYVMIKSHGDTFAFPESYATLLQKLGHVKIIGR